MYDLVNSLKGHFNVFGKRNLGYSQGFQKLFKENFTWMRRDTVFWQHDFVSQ